MFYIARFRGGGIETYVPNWRARERYSDGAARTAIRNETQLYTDLIITGLISLCCPKSSSSCFTNERRA